MTQEKEKVKYLIPGDKLPLDTSIKTVNVGSAIFMGLLVAILITSFTLLVLARNFPFFPIPQGLSPPDHVKFFWKSILPVFSIGEYTELIYKWKQGDLLSYLSYRWIFSVIVGIGSGIYIFMKSLTPVGGDKHVKGKLVLKGKEAYNNLKKEFDFLSANGRGSGLVVASYIFNPTIDLIKNIKNALYIELPEKLRRAHTMVLGGTGRGKTQLIMYRFIAQIYHQIRNGEVIKLLICDTPKGDYFKFFHRQHIFLINPEDAKSHVWNIAKDLYNALVAEKFWKGKIPANDNDPIWANAAVAVGTGCTRFLQVVAPEGWNYGMLAHVLTKGGDELEPLITEHYPEAKQILNAAGETLSSVLFNLGTYTTDLIALGRIHDGYDIKKAIRQSTAKALKNSEYVDYVYEDMVRNSVVGDNEETLNITRASMFKGVCLYLTATKPDWRWVDFAEFVKQPKNTQAKLVEPFLDPNKEAKVIQGLQFYQWWLKLSEIIVHYAEEWDGLENKKKLSIRDWIMNENPGRKILVLKPSETFPTLTEGLIKGILYYANSVILGELEDNRKRKFHILLDELQSYGNIYDFIGPALSLYRSRGCSLIYAFQDLSQLVKIYGQEVVDFMNSNTGNIMILGVNDGFTANKLTELLGEKKIEKLHRHRSSDGGGNEDLQHHDEKVIYANEWNLLGANDATMKMTYLYLVGGLNPAYMLEAPIIPYKTRSEVIKADWLTSKPVKPKFPSLESQWGIVKSSAGSVGGAKTTLTKTISDVVTQVNQEVTASVNRIEAKNISKKINEFIDDEDLPTPEELEVEEKEQSEENIFRQ
jgi:hypothetical protein